MKLVQKDRRKKVGSALCTVTMQSCIGLGTLWCMADAESQRCVGLGWNVEGLYYLEYQSVYPFVRTGSPNPFPASECAPLHGFKGGGGQLSLGGERAGEPNSDDWRKSLALCILSGLEACANSRLKAR
jgi:hypothetical protein